MNEAEFRNRQTETHPGAAPDADAFAKGWREGVAAAWKAIEAAQDAGTCRMQIAALGNKGLAL